MDGCEKRRQLACDGLFHLVACEAARDEDTAEKFIRIDFPHACKTGKRMHVEPVASIHHSDRISVRHRVRCHLERDMEYRTVAVEQENLAGLFRKGTDDTARIDRHNGA